MTTSTHSQAFMDSNQIRHDFSIAMSEMYQVEVPLYADLIDLVSKVNDDVMQANPEIKAQLEHTGELPRLGIERHGAIRLGTADELSMMRRLFAVMGMQPVGYYDLTSAGVPVHSTAFRAIDAKSLSISPFRVFTSLLRLDLIDDDRLRQLAQDALAQRQIFTDRATELIATFEEQGGLTHKQGKEFVQAALETFRWHDTSPLTKQMYEQLLGQHRLIADIVGFKGPHINHLTPRTLDIDAAQHGMVIRGIPAKDIIEGPPRRNCPILLRQTSFKALDEPVNFKAPNADNDFEAGYHTARFGEIEQRGVALTPKGRALYDELLNQARSTLGTTPTKDNADQYYDILAKAFAAFPDDYASLHEQGLAYFYYQPSPDYQAHSDDTSTHKNIDKLLAELSAMSSNQSANDSADFSEAHVQYIQKLLQAGVIRIEPIVYEDFLPVSAAGIFQSNLKSGEQSHYEGQSNKADFEQALGSTVHDELALYADMQHKSWQACLNTLQKQLAHTA